MPPKTLKGKILLAVSLFVLLSGLAIALLVTQRYSRALRETMLRQAENLAHAVALDAADKILINDLVGLQKMLDQQRRGNPSLSYLFVHRDGRVLAHTFDQGVPAGLLAVNQPLSNDQPGFREIASEKGEHFLDTAWPILASQAGVLRLGYSESHYRRQMARLWAEIGLFTLVILLVALSGGLLFVRRITRPLGALVEATREIDQGRTNVRVAVAGEDEIAVLAASFNQMVTRQEDYTRRLEAQTLELEQAYSQTRAACQIVREVSALGTLEEMGAFLLNKFKEATLYPRMALLIFNVAKDTLFVLSNQGTATSLRDPRVVQTARRTLEGLAQIGFFPKPLIKPPLVPEDLLTSGAQAIVPFADGQISGAVVMDCAPSDQVTQEKFQWVSLILSQNSGALGRVVRREEEISGLKDRVEAQAGFGELIGKDPKMQVVYQLIEDVAPADATVLIQGESGTGKELVARAIYRLSPRQAGPFVVINCSAYPVTLLESELFGHEKGAFTGAMRQKAGRFEQAHGGTVFLDEVGDIPLPAQIKLLRVLQTHKFERVGGEQTLTVDVRVLAATHKDLLKEVLNGNFREDLYYRLNVIPLSLPPLRERKNDIPLLARHFLTRFAAEKGKDLQGFSSEGMRLLLDYQWPGNVRELENTIEHAAVLAKGRQVEAWDFPISLRALSSVTPSTLAQREAQALLEILEECGWNKKLAAKHLGISRSTLYAMLKKYKISGSKPITH